MSAEFLFRASKSFKGTPTTGQTNKQGAALWTNRKFRTFLYAMIGAYVCLAVRCVYRIAEMAGGWGNHIMQDEPSFIVLESFMVLIGSGLLAGVPAGDILPAHVAFAGYQKLQVAADNDTAAATATDNEGVTVSSGQQTESDSPSGEKTAAAAV